MRRVLILLLGLLFSAQLPADETSAAYQYRSDVPGVTESMLDVEFWLSQLQGDELLMDTLQIQAFNRNAIAIDSHLFDLEGLPQTLPRDRVVELIARVSRAASSPRYFASNDAPVKVADYRRWQQATNLDTIPPMLDVRWGLVVKRANMRSFPTAQRILKHSDDDDLDRLQETAVFPGERLAILHRSEDGQWLFVLNYHYAAWLPRAAVALGARDQIDAWAKRVPRLMVTGARVRSVFNPQESRHSELPLEMGVSLPLLSAAQTGHSVHGQNPHASYIVEMPLRNEGGGLEFSPMLIARSQDVDVGPLPFTEENLLRQSFKFLGERYGWGHDYNGRDCTGLVGEVYKSFDIIMPRNTSQQEKGTYAAMQRFAKGDRKAVKAALQNLAVGDLIYIPGHVMMVIGRVGEEPYVIHDRIALNYFQPDGEFYQGTLSGVSITPMNSMYEDEKTSFVDSITAIMRIRAPGD